MNFRTESLGFQWIWPTNSEIPNQCDTDPQCKLYKFGIFSDINYEDEIDR